MNLVALRMRESIRPMQWSFCHDWNCKKCWNSETRGCWLIECMFHYLTKLSTVTLSYVTVYYSFSSFRHDCSVGNNEGITACWVWLEARGLEERTFCMLHAFWLLWSCWDCIWAWLPARMSGLSGCSASDPFGHRALQYVWKVLTT